MKKALILIGLMLVMLTYTVAYGEEYAEVILGEENICTNASVIENLLDCEAGGKSTKMSDGIDFFHIDVSDLYAYNLPEFTPIDITVTYLDSGYGSFSLSYDSHNPDPYFGEDNYMWAATEFVRLKNSKKWKSYTFHIEDMRFRNFCGNGSDFRIGVWDPYMNFSDSDVTFKSVRVEKSELNTPIKFNGISSEYTGNIFSECDDIMLYHNIENKTANTVKASYDYRVYDEQGNLYCERKITKNISAKAQDTLTISMKNPKVYGTYKVVITEKTDSTQSEYKSEFSVSKKLDESFKNSMYGICQQVAGGNVGEADEVINVMSDTGLGILRDELRWDIIEKSPGVYEIPEEKLNEINLIADSGKDIMLVLCYWNPLYDNGMTPHTDEGITAFANYAAYLASTLKGKVKYFEVWNEYNAMPLFNNGYEPPETYAKMLKATYTAIKEVNKDAVVVGIGTGDINKEFAKTVFDNGGYDYLDAVSVHAYDWSGKFDEVELKSQVLEFKELMSNYGEVKPLYFTEIGWSTFDGGNTRLPGWAKNAYPYTEEEQAATSVFVNAYCKANNLCDMLLQYCMYDKEDKCDIEENLGICDMWNSRKNVPGGAKKSYLATSAFNYFVGNAEFKSITEDGRNYGFFYYNNELDRDVLLLASGEGQNDMSFSFDCDTVDVFDMYGNLKEALTSDDGNFSFKVCEIPYYVVGNFKFSDDEYCKIEKNGDIITVSGKTNKRNADITFIAEKKWSVDRSVVAADQQKSDEYGRFAFSFLAEESAVYSVFVFDGEEKTGESINDIGYDIEVEYFADGEKVIDYEKIEKASEIKAVLTVTDSNGAGESLLFFGAVYDCDGRFINADMSEINWNGEREATVEVKLNVDRRLRFMLWKKNIEPISLIEDIFVKLKERN